MSASFIVPDDLRGHIHRCTSQAIICAHTRRHARGATGYVRPAGPLYRSLILSKNFRCAEVYIFDDAHVIQENICDKLKTNYSDDGKVGTHCLA